MRSLFVITCLVIVTSLLVSFTGNGNDRDLRKIYSGPPASWPRPWIEEGIQWSELGSLPQSPWQAEADSLKHLVKLGTLLFFDPRLSSSGKISCATCHQPALSWTDGRERSQGHEGALNKRNSPGIQNVWFYKSLFWDGRARDLEDQAFAPINSESEMHGDMRMLPRNLGKIKSYPALFDSAFGDPGIDPDRIAYAIATFERTITSAKSRFDLFLEGNRKAMSNAEIRGLHLFRTKARCMNCHHGAMFSDNGFHDGGFHLNGDPNTDKGRYQVTHRDEDIGKFKTPSLRDVMRTGPWMHNGMMKNMPEIIAIYNNSSPKPGGGTQALNLAPGEQRDLLAFLNAITAAPLPFREPVLPE